MAKKITRIVLTGGPAAGKTTLISRILKEFKQDDGWKVITIPETATELISGFGIKPFGNCVSMLEFQYFVIEDQLHKERLALKAAQMVPEENVLVIYDRALLDDKAYVSDEEFRTVLSSFGKTEEEFMAGYDAVLHLVSCARRATSRSRSRGRRMIWRSARGRTTRICASSTTPLILKIKLPAVCARSTKRSASPCRRKRGTSTSSRCPISRF